MTGAHEVPWVCYSLVAPPANIHMLCHCSCSVFKKAVAFCFFRSLCIVVFFLIYTPLCARKSSFFTIYACHEMTIVSLVSCTTLTCNEGQVVGHCETECWTSWTTVLIQQGCAHKKTTVRTCVRVLGFDLGDNGFKCLHWITLGQLLPLRLFYVTMLL